MDAGGVLVMAKSKPKRGPKPDPSRRMGEVIRFRARTEYAEYLRDWADEKGEDVAAIIERAIECQAGREGRSKPPPRQM